MKLLKEKLKNYKIKKSDNSKLQSFQDYALEVIEEFGITGIYKKIIFKHAKRNKTYLQGKVENLREKYKNRKSLGRLLTYLITKNK